MTLIPLVGLINPRRACAAMVTVVVSCVCLYVCTHALFFHSVTLIEAPLYCFADVAEWLMNRCINKREEVDVSDTTGLFAFPEAGRDSAVEYNFQFLEDFADQCSRFPGMRFFRKEG